MAKRLLLLVILVAGAQMLASASVIVPGTSNIWLSGMPNGTTENCCDAAPGQSPVLAPLSLTNILSLQFAVTGTSSNGPCCALVGPDGTGMFNRAGNYGMSGITAPVSALVGVFLTNQQPDLSTAPAALDFSAGNGLNFTSLSPALQQVFFIGDGLTSGAAVQSFYVPTGATRLFLGTVDGFEWNNNLGSLTVDIQATPIPEPGFYWLTGAGLAALAYVRRRK